VKAPPTTVGTASPLAGFLDNISGLAVEGTGTFYVSQGGSGNVVRASGGMASCVPGTGSNSQSGVAADQAGNVYFSFSNAVYKANSSGATIYAGNGLSGCTGGSIGNPQGLTVDMAGNLYIADEWCNVVWKVPPGGTPIAQ
jgi:hypothetical protein